MTYIYLLHGLYKSQGKCHFIRKNVIAWILKEVGAIYPIFF